jgi:hypothetical protein
MAGGDDYSQIINNSIGRTYSFSEAIDLVRVLDKYRTYPNQQIQWVDAKTGKPVTIGYVGHSSK